VFNNNSNLFKAWALLFSQFKNQFSINQSVNLPDQFILDNNANSKKDFSLFSINIERNKNILNSKENEKKVVSGQMKEKPLNSKSKVRNSRSISNYRQQVVSITYEEIGLFPRSFNRVFDRFFKQLFFDVENLVIQEYRFYRYLFLTTVKCVFILICVPLVINFCSKNYLIRPITEYYWNSQQPEIFLNSYMQKRAFNELKDFEEKIYFESLIQSRFSRTITTNAVFDIQGVQQNNESKLMIINGPEKTQSFTFNSNKNNSIVNTNLEYKSLVPINQDNNYFSNLFLTIRENNELFQVSRPINLQTNNINYVSSNTHEQKYVSNSLNEGSDINIQFNEYIQQRLQKKIFELAIHYNEESIEAITNFFADFISFSTLWFLLLNLEIQINITKSFLLEVFFGLDDSKKSLLILFITDLLVGYHSPNIWELFFSSLFDHYGLPENQTTIFLLVATLPVLLDVLFKYLIFRHLNRASPATVATYHAMIE
jgi:hypothetical protein